MRHDPARRGAWAYRCAHARRSRPSSRSPCFPSSSAGSGSCPAQRSRGTPTSPRCRTDSRPACRWECRSPADAGTPICAGPAIDRADTLPPFAALARSDADVPAVRLFPRARIAEAGHVHPFRRRGDHRRLDLLPVQQAIVFGRRQHLRLAQLVVAVANRHLLGRCVLHARYR